MSAGDDVYAPNAREFELTPPQSLQGILNKEIVAKYLPCVSLSKTYWFAICDGQKVAEIEHFCHPERNVIIKLIKADYKITDNKVFFQYEKQERLGK